jgi:site-specific recombinase XerD
VVERGRAPESPRRSEQPELPARFRRPIEDFLDALRHESGLAPRTLAAYRRDLEAFARRQAARGVESPEQLTEQHLIDDLAHLRCAPGCVSRSPRANSTATPARG